MVNTLSSGSTDTPAYSNPKDAKSPARRAALAIANELRKKLGYPPVDHLYPGLPRNGEHCPITNTVYNDNPELRLKYRVNTRGSAAFVRKLDSLGTMIVWVDLDSDARTFVRKFDKGEAYQDLAR